MIHLKKLLFLTTVYCSLITICNGQTPVTLSVQDATGSPFDITTIFTPQAVPGLNYPNINYGGPITIVPVNGVITTNLLEGPFTLTFVGNPKTMHVYVPGFWATNCGFTLPINLADLRWQITAAGQIILVQTNLVVITNNISAVTNFYYSTNIVNITNNLAGSNLVMVLTNAGPPTVVSNTLTLNTNYDAGGAAAAQGAANTNDAAARVLAQGVESTNFTVATATSLTNVIATSSNAAVTAAGTIGTNFTVATATSLTNDIATSSNAAVTAAGTIGTNFTVATATSLTNDIATSSNAAVTITIRNTNGTAQNLTEITNHVMAHWDFNSGQGVDASTNTVDTWVAGIPALVGHYITITSGVMTNTRWNGSALVFQNPTWFWQNAGTNCYSISGGGVITNGSTVNIVNGSPSPVPQYAVVGTNNLPGPIGGEVAMLGDLTIYGNLTLGGVISGATFTNTTFRGSFTNYGQTYQKTISLFPQNFSSGITEPAQVYTDSRGIASFVQGFDSNSFHPQSPFWEIQIAMTNAANVATQANAYLQWTIREARAPNTPVASFYFYDFNSGAAFHGGLNQLGHTNVVSFNLDNGQNFSGNPTWSQLTVQDGVFYDGIFVGNPTPTGGDLPGIRWDDGNFRPRADILTGNFPTNVVTEGGQPALGLAMNDPDWQTNVFYVRSNYPMYTNFYTFIWDTNHVYLHGFPMAAFNGDFAWQSAMKIYSNSSSGATLSWTNDVSLGATVWNLNCYGVNDAYLLATTTTTPIFELASTNSPSDPVNGWIVWNFGNNLVGTSSLKTNSVVVTQVQGAITNGWLMHLRNVIADSGDGHGLTNLTSLLFTNSPSSYLASGSAQTVTAAGFVSVNVTVTNTQIVWLTNLTSHVCASMGNIVVGWTNYANAQLMCNLNDSILVTNISGSGGATLNSSWFQVLH